MRWVPKPADPDLVRALADSLRSNITLQLTCDSRAAATLARLLVMRGIADAEAAERFLAPSLAHLHSPYTMSGMKAAVDRLETAIERK